ncbi:GTPase RsgA [Bosea sp. Leaf344]|uniref:ribosome small subunit-dependent GTPase A n=1 Tax=Bosea sp. Leaf344 TaxID=1736346 RepID=UPI0007009036|nr:ribosome small subunit-dependent GTPase A [Bosea sp. Leaf344]KQU55009.1 GTPase RsgA [Bosea sp. Leaf344]
MSARAGGPERDALAAMGWSDFFEEQIEPGEEACLRGRIATVHRARLTAIGPDGPLRPVLPEKAQTGDYAVGDWVLLDRAEHRLLRRLERKTVLSRRTEGSRVPQLAGANIDTLFIVTSCNADFNVARLERYLALANQAGTQPVILLTKADMAEEPETFRRQAEALQRDLPVVLVNPRGEDVAARLSPWCGPGRTVALVGSSGVGKSTLVNALVGPEQAEPQQTGGIREHDAKGRHTTTARSLHAMAGGGWVIDTPGMRTLHVADVGEGIETLFAEITELAPSCRFRDCSHEHEPGCAVQAAVRAGTLDPERLARWRKLQGENKARTPVLSGPRGNKR